jgi:hypothetical protein
VLTVAGYSSTVILPRGEGREPDQSSWGPNPLGIPLGRTGPGIQKGGNNMYETPMLVEIGAFTDLTRRPKRGRGHDHRCKQYRRPKGGHDY